MAIALRPATAKDLGFAFALALNGARHGHYDLRVSTDKASFRNYFSMAIGRGTDPWGNPTQVLIAHTDQGRVGSLVITKAIGAPDGGVELAMISVKTEHQALGYGTLLLDSLLDRYLPVMSVYARCLPASEKLRRMLERRGFDAVGRIENSIVLRHGAIGKPHLEAAVLCAARLT